MAITPSRSSSPLDGSLFSSPTAATSAQHDGSGSASNKRRRIKRATSPSEFNISGKEAEAYGESHTLNLPARHRMDNLLNSISSLYSHPSTLAQPFTTSTTNSLNAQTLLTDLQSEARHYSTLDMLLSPIRKRSILDSWSGKDIALFESGICKYGKDFHSIRYELMPHKQTTELVNFYYTVWKKSVHCLTWKRAGVDSNAEVMQLRNSASSQQLNEQLLNGNGITTRSRLKGEVTDKPPATLPLRGATNLPPMPAELREQVLALTPMLQQQQDPANGNNVMTVDAISSSSTSQNTSSDAINTSEESINVNDFSQSSSSNSVSDDAANSAGVSANDAAAEDASNGESSERVNTRKRGRSSGNNGVNLTVITTPASAAAPSSNGKGSNGAAKAWIAADEAIVKTMALRGESTSTIGTRVGRTAAAIRKKLYYMGQEDSSFKRQLADVRAMKPSASPLPSVNDSMLNSDAE